MTNKTKPDTNTLYVRIDGMFCDHCRYLMTKALVSIPEVRKVSFDNQIAVVAWQSDTGSASGHSRPDLRQSVVKAVLDAGYVTKIEWIGDKKSDLKDYREFRSILLILAVILAIAFALRRLFGYNIFNAIPTIDSSLSYGMLFVTGLLTSIHCISMCGAINLTATASPGRPGLLAPVLYNTGRILSYTAVGAAVGLLGSVFSLHPTVAGILLLLAAVIMLLMALSMLGLIRFHLPQPGGFRHFGRSAFVIGLLNGLMPCGPLQSMQLYALSTGSALRGALSMLLFGLGTVPLMLLMGALAGIFTGRVRVWFNRAAAVMIAILSVLMLYRALLTLGVQLPGKPAAVLSQSGSYEGYLTARLTEDGFQEVSFELDYDHYADIAVQTGIPVRMHILVPEDKLTGCNNALVCSNPAFEAQLQAGENVITFTPGEPGDYIYTCWMHMISNTIRVADDKGYFIGQQEE